MKKLIATALTTAAIITGSMFNIMHGDSGTQQQTTPQQVTTVSNHTQVNKASKYKKAYKHNGFIVIGHKGNTSKVLYKVVRKTDHKVYLVNVFDPADTTSIYKHQYNGHINDIVVITYDGDWISKVSKNKSSYKYKNIKVNGQKI